MAPAIVYEGGGGGGSLFDGIKFWVAQRVPTRDTFIDLIKSNGGEITKLEKNADVMIADHARKDAPPGAHSWKYVEQSIKNGRLENLDDWKIARAPAKRTVGSGGLTKRTRTEFTASDDRILTAYVLRMERMGKATKGNMIFEDFASENPRHTMQSWRDRWVKQLSHRVHTQSAEEDNEAGLEEAGEPQQLHRATREGRDDSKSENLRASPTVVDLAQHGPQRRRLLVHKPGSKAASVQREPSPAPFTEEEINLLISEYEDIQNCDPMQLSEAWATFAYRNSTHSASEWQDFFNTDVRPTVERRLAKKKRREKRVAIDQQVAMTSPVKASQPAESSRNDLMDSASTKGVARQSKNRSHASGSSSGIKVTSFGTDKEFYESLNDWADIEGFVVNLNAMICGKRVSLFRLWQTVNSPMFSGFDRVDDNKQWRKVATMMNFNAFRSEEAPQQLRELYDDQLRDFEISHQEYQEDIRQLAGLTGIDHEQNPDSAKRQSTQDSPVKSSKRKRMNKGKQREIPSTPDGGNESETSRQLYIQSPILEGDEQADSGDLPSIEDMFDELFVKSDGRVPYPALPGAAEPETQDFDYHSPEPKGRLGVDLKPRQNNRESQLLYPHSEDDLEGVDEVPEQMQVATKRETELQEFVDKCIGRGYSKPTIIEAMEVTTLHTGKAMWVMTEIANGNGVPGDIAGVWTAEDDAAIGPGGTHLEQEVDAVIKKHGNAELASRRRYLRKKMKVEKLLARESGMDLGLL